MAEKDIEKLMEKQDTKQEPDNVAPVEEVKHEQGK